MNRCKVTIDVEREAVEGYTHEGEFARVIREAIQDRIDGKVSIRVRVFEKIMDKEPLTWCNIGYSPSCMSIRGSGAGGQGGAAHPDPDPTPEETP